MKIKTLSKNKQTGLRVSECCMTCKFVDFMYDIFPNKIDTYATVGGTCNLYRGKKIEIYFICNAYKCRYENSDGC